jgi:hypothetical protein
MKDDRAGLPLHEKLTIVLKWKQRLTKTHGLFIGEIALTAGTSYGSALIMHRGLGNHKICATWVPRRLTEGHKQTRLQISESLLQNYSEECENLLKTTVKGDETRAHHMNHALNDVVLSGNTPHLRRQKNSNPRPSEGNVILPLFWGCNRPILEDYLQQCTTVTLKYLNTIWSRWLAASAEVSCLKAFFCSTITRVRIPRQIPLKQSGIWHLNFSLTPPPLIQSLPSSTGLSHVWTTKRKLARKKTCL